jgi:CutA1 divalent ion tolerance protein
LSPVPHHEGTTLAAGRAWCRPVERTNGEHSYDVLAVIALPIVAGNAAYIDWVLAETLDPAEPPAAVEPVY